MKTRHATQIRHGITEARAGNNLNYRVETPLTARAFIRTLHSLAQAELCHVLNWEWLQKNGVRHYVPEDARIIITGTHIITPTLDIGRAYNPGYARGYKQGKDLPIKIRKYRIRHKLTIPREGRK